jgi:predicted transposase YdaD
VSHNPFAFIAQAHIEARETGDDPNRRYDLRMALQDAVETSGLKKREVLLVTRFIEEVMRLPEDLHRKLFFERLARKEDKKMVYTTYAERIGERRGVKKGVKKGKLESRQELVLKLLEMRFNKVSKRVQTKVSSLSDLAVLDELFAAAFQCSSLKEFESLLPAE